jgi:hypothetical protein
MSAPQLGLALVAPAFGDVGDRDDDPAGFMFDRIDDHLVPAFLAVASIVAAKPRHSTREHRFDCLRKRSRSIDAAGFGAAAFAEEIAPDDRAISPADAFSGRGSPRGVRVHHDSVSSSTAICVERESRTSFSTTEGRRPVSVAVPLAMGIRLPGNFEYEACASRLISLSSGH